jgi:hypothetical protein
MRAALLVQLLRCPKSNNGLVWILLTHQFGVTMRATLKKVKKRNKEGRLCWSERENLRLVSAWLKNSNDPIVGVDRRGDRY